MNRLSLPLALLAALAAASPPAVALPPLRADLVDDATLAALNGRYFDAQMLVGLRVDLVSSVATPQQGAAMASGSLLLLREGAGLRVRSDARSAAAAGSGADASAASAGGAESVRVHGIGQVAQIAGDGNRLSNLASIEFVDAAGLAADAGGFNGRTHSDSAAGGLRAQVTFLDRGAAVGVQAPGVSLQQRLDGGLGGIAQSGRIAGDGVAAGNRLQLQIATAPMTPQRGRELGLLQALAGLSGVPR
ncbi:hypothetical protein SAMN04487939_12453 [Lysobacter sp. yr284]|uniref:hypothetical protein n=1 Tax=Lysobacter sp. yr284 TaxID=1761791 RepID=UPI000897E318|nr:hypothetical protein [Lysobacter sp. yr284]SDZ22400.1 hypothetical protein SAMN04487939_12453 [Lysobacter sp. yr284]